MLDRYHIGIHTRQSPEADVPLILQDRIEDRLGGAANVALNLKQMGLHPTLIASVGNDEAGNVLADLCESLIQDVHLARLDRPTTLKSRVVDQEFRQYLRLDREQTSDYESDKLAELGALLSSQLPGASALIIQDYNKGIFTEKFITSVQQMAMQHRIPIIVDPKKSHFRLLSQCTIFKPNIKELSQAYGAPVPPEAEAITKALRALDIKAEQTFVTLGAKGIYYQDSKSQEMGIIDGLPVSDADVSGAGDTVLSALTLAHILAQTVQNKASMANKAGALVCEKKGICAISAAELGVE